MALSGSLDTFELPDVLRLLASTAKTGRLRIAGDRGSGSVWVDGGQVVATELTGASPDQTTDEEAIFGMLRFAAGSFTFEADATLDAADSPRALDPMLGAAEVMLVEWRAIEEVVPSLDVWVILSSELDGPEVMIDAARWRSIVAVGSGAEVRAVARALDLGEIDACRTVKELIELGLFELTVRPFDAPTPQPGPARHLEAVLADEIPAAVETHAAETHALETHAVETPPAETPAVERAMSDETSATFGHEVFVSEEQFDTVGSPADADPLAPPETATVPSLASLEPSADPGSDDPLLSSGDPLAEMAQMQSDDSSNDLFAAPTAEETASGDLDPAEMARQLANLSPKAAKAVAAAAKASTEAERDAALAAVEAEDDSVNRGLLLKFLGSVDS